MDRFWIALIIAVIAVAISAAVTPALIALASRLGLLSVPTEERQVHTRPLPRIGGLAMYLAFTVGIAVSFSLPVERFPIEVERVALLLAATGLLVAVMVYDDLVGLSPRTKLLFQVLAAGLIIFPRLRGEDHGLVIEHFTNPFGGVVELPLLLAIAFTFFWIIGMMNTLNWIDGLDGLAGSVTLVAASVLFLHTYFRPSGDPQFTISLLAVALGGATIGFMIFNWFPARILMGDVGAMFLGFSLAVISIIGGAKIATALLALWIPILDVAWVIIFRVLNGRSPLHADRGHLHHRLLDLGWSQPQIVLLLAGLSAVFGGASLLISESEVKLYALIGAGVVGVTLLAVLARRASRLPSRQATEFSRRS